MINTTTYLDDYKPTNFNIVKVNLEFDLHKEHTLVLNTMHIKRMCAGELHLAGDELELISIKLDDEILAPTEYEISADGLILKNCPDDFQLTIQTKIFPQNNTQLSGLFKTKNLFCTQCEAEGFRRITYFYDRPDVLTEYTTKISADKKTYPVLLSNGNLIKSGEDINGRHWVIWHDPFKKPSYLFALVAGNLAYIEDHFLTKSKQTITLRIYVDPSDVNKCQHAMSSLKKAMRWDEEEYGREYDLSTFMIVAVSDFNMGAMENKGLNIFNSKYILANESSATDADYLDIEGVVAHEYFHNWTGNRVTCRDWFQLSLKEGLTVFRDQEFSRDMNSRDVFRIADVKILRSAQFPEDSGAMAHPVRPTSYQEISNFYTATIYNKGAEVIRMQRTLLGRDGFRRGMDLYFERYDGKAVTIDDFVASMEDANGVDFSQFKNWYSQARTPVVSVQSSFANNSLILNFTQTCEPSPECKNKKPFHIPIKIALFDKLGEIIPIEKDIIELREPEQTFKFTNLAEKPTISFLRDFSAPIILQTDASLKDLLTLLKYETDGFAKWDASQKLAVNTILNCYKTANNSWHVADELIAAYKHVLLDDSQDTSLRAELLTPPTFEIVVNEEKLVDVAKIEDARDFFKHELGKSLYDELQKTYEVLWQAEKNSMDNKSYGARKLLNLCLQLMMVACEDKALVYCQNQFAKAKTMTCQLASLSLLVNSSQESYRQEALEEFYSKWQHDELVIDKWFAVQALAKTPDILEKIRRLLAHKDFNIKNPNRLRSVIVPFCQENHKYFHAPDGSGYKFLTDIILQVDKINPQLSSRIATPYSRWQVLDLQRQELIQSELSILSQMNLSKDLREIVIKSLPN